MQEQLHRLSLSRWTLPSRAATSSYPSTAATPATWAFFMWTDMPKVGQQTRRTLKASVTQEQQMPFSAWLSLTRCSYFPLPHPSRARDLQPDILHHPRSALSWPDSSSALFALCYLPLKWGKKNDTIFLLVAINKGSWVYPPLSWSSYLEDGQVKHAMKHQNQTNNYILNGNKLT